MGRVFNICFEHKNKSYTALVSVNGKEDTSIKVTTNSDSIQILLPTGRLIFSITDVLQRMYAGPTTSSSNTIFHVTPNISLQLLNTDWWWNFKPTQIVWNDVWNAYCEKYSIPCNSIFLIAAERKRRLGERYDTIQNHQAPYSSSFCFMQARKFKGNRAFCRQQWTLKALRHFNIGVNKACFVSFLLPLWFVVLFLFYHLNTGGF